MKTLRIVSLLLIATSISLFSFAQDIKTETIPVSGVCGMCKARIEKAAKEAGAESADWNVDTKILTVTYNETSITGNKIQQAIANVGHDTRDYKATTKAYNSLPSCCKYERKAAETKTGSK